MKKKTPTDKTITLCMIVKNETHIVHECLESMVPYIDRYDITDTGSTDGTPEKIKEIMDKHNIPGEVYLSDWKGFGDHSGKMGSRTESLRNCDGKADYAWVIDADDKIEGDFKYPDHMDADAYSLRIGRQDFVWWRNQIFKTGVDWRYIGVLHEYAECKGKTPVIMRHHTKGYNITARTLGARNVGIDVVEKYTRDAKELEEAIKHEPDNTRYYFYLAQSYFDSQQYEKSLDAYSKRATMGGWEEEAYYSLYRVAMIKAILNHPWEEIQQAFLDAFDFRPTRAEPLYQIARIYRQLHNKPKLGYMFARMALEIPYPKEDILFIHEDVYRYQILDEIGACAYYAGKPHVGYQACKRMIDENLLPDGHRERVMLNLHQYEKVMQEIHAHEAQMKIDQQIMEMDNKRQAKIHKINTEKKSTKSNQRKKGKKRVKTKG
jgi:glycosyltransferase involved in cell wall biosynthesis